MAVGEGLGGEVGGIGLPLRVQAVKVHECFDELLCGRVAEDIEVGHYILLGREAAHIEHVEQPRGLAPGNVGALLAREIERVATKERIYVDGGDHGTKKRAIGRLLELM